MHEPMVVGQRWTDLEVPSLGGWTPSLRVAVVLPARDNQPELDRTLAALAHQTYPKDLTEVVVVDDASATPLVLPQLAPTGTRVVRREEQSSHGSGAARHAGAVSSDADILLFLDSDMMADPRHVEAHARWHHAFDRAVVLGHKWFVSVDGITSEDIDVAARDRLGLEGLLEGRRWGRHDWQEEQIEASHGLTDDRDDTFLAVVGATVSIRREFYAACGGFSAFGLRGIVDTEFGYRAFTMGGLIIPDEEARSWHQGARNFAKRGEEIKLARTGLAANYLPLEMFRLQDTGRRWAVPRASVIVDATGAGPEGVVGEAEASALLLTVDSVLSSDLTDLHVTVVTGDAELPGWWLDYYAHESRVSQAAEPPASGFPSPLTVVVRPGVLLSRDSLTRAVGLLDGEVSLVRTLPDEYATPTVEVWRTRALERARSVGLTDLSPGSDEEVGLGGRWCTASALGMSRVRPRRTAQGMITHW